MLEITQKHDFEAKFFLGLGVGLDHLWARLGPSTGSGPKNREKIFFSEMLEITQKHDFEAKKFLGLGGRSDHL